MKINHLLILLLSMLFLQAKAQDFFTPLNHELNTRYDEFLARKDVKFIPTERNYRADELREYIPFDSLESDMAKHYYPRWRKEKHSWVNRKIFSEHFIEVNDSAERFHLTVDPLFDVKVGRNQIIHSGPSGITKGQNIFGNT